jgi:hypothetical protein
MSTVTIRDNLNGVETANKLSDICQSIGMGELLSYLLAKASYTETGITVTSNVATLANAPTSQGLFKCVVASVSSGSATGSKTLLRGPISGVNAIVPVAGQCVWDGNLKVLFAAADLAATASFTYAVSTDVASVTQKSLGQ